MSEQEAQENQALWDSMQNGPAAVDAKLMLGMTGEDAPENTDTSVAAGALEPEGATVAIEAAENDIRTVPDCLGGEYDWVAQECFTGRIA